MARDSKGRFLSGYDKDRHLLTTEERRKGYLRATTDMEEGEPCDDPEVCAWVYRKVRSYYRARKNGQSSRKKVKRHKER